MPTQYPIIDLVDTEGKVVEQGFRKTAPDHIYVHGRLKAGSVFAITLRGGEPINELGLVWTIHGEKGDIQVTSPKAPIWVGVDGVKITIKLLGEEEKAVPIETDEWSDLGQWKTNVARLYEEYRKGEAGSYMDFEQALKMHRLIDYMYKSSDSGQTVTIK